MWRCALLVLVACSDHGKHPVDDATILDARTVCMITVSPPVDVSGPCTTTVREHGPEPLQDSLFDIHLTGNDTIDFKVMDSAGTIGAFPSCANETSADHCTYVGTAASWRVEGGDTSMLGSFMLQLDAFVDAQQHDVAHGTLDATLVSTGQPDVTMHATF